MFFDQCLEPFLRESLDCLEIVLREDGGHVSLRHLQVSSFFYVMHPNLVGKQFQDGLLGFPFRLLRPLAFLLVELLQLRLLLAQGNHAGPLELRSRQDVRLHVLLEHIVFLD